ncbi:MAG: DNA-binding response regulator [Oscillatoriales cyanobacterium]|nr:MAG: DNA-binding response regulator [Oscillatoriales cyanobacterium]
MKILLVEDDDRIAQALAEALTDQHYAVDIAADGQEGWNFAETFTYDRLRRQGLKTPVLMLTARDTSNDKVIGLDAGADDYVVKPFDLPELAARIRALLRRGSTTLPPVLEWENLRLNPNTCEVTYRDNLLHFTPKEYSLLELFLRTGGRVLTRSAILDHIWAFEDSPGEETVKVHLRGLRQKLKAAGAPANFIETIYGMGYRLNQNL